MAQIDLIPEARIRRSERVKKAISYTIGIIALALVLIAWVALFSISRFYYQPKIDDLNNQISSVNTAINQKSAAIDKIVAFQKQLSNIKSLIEKHVVWNDMISEIEQLTVKTIQFESVDFDAAGKITLKGVAQNSLSVAKQVSSFRYFPNHPEFTKFSSVTTQDLGVNDKGQITFTITLAFDPASLVLTSSAASASVPVPTPSLTPAPPTTPIPAPVPAPQTTQ